MSSPSRAMMAQLSAVTFTVIVATTAAYMLKSSGREATIIGPIIYASIGVLVSLIYVFFFRTLYKHPTPLRIALIGNPGAGKTVYISVLFNELPVLREMPISFQPYGRDTIEEVARNISTLSSGHWLPKSIPGVIFPFRATARVATRIFPRRYTLEIGDYAGEHIREFDSSSEEWLHRSKFFEYAAASDVLFLAVDAGLLCDGLGSEVQFALNRLIAAFQVLMDQRGVEAGRKCRIPVGILALKSDLLPEGNESKQKVSSALNRLISLCDSRCEYSKVFFLSSTGPLSADGKPPTTLHPTVVDPILWALSLPLD